MIGSLKIVAVLREKTRIHSQDSNADCLPFQELEICAEFYDPTKVIHEFPCLSRLRAVQVNWKMEALRPIFVAQAVSP